MIVKKNKSGFAGYADREYKKGEVICIMKGKTVVPRTLEYHGSDFLKASINPLQTGHGRYMDLLKPFRYSNH